MFASGFLKWIYFKKTPPTPLQVVFNLTFKQIFKLAFLLEEVVGGIIYIQTCGMTEVTSVIHANNKWAFETQSTAENK